MFTHSPEEFVGLRSDKHLMQNRPHEKEGNLR